MLRRRSARWEEVGWGVLGSALVAGVLELLSRTDVVDRHFFPPVTEMARRLIDELGHAPFWSAVGETLQGWAIGLGVAVALAVPLGIAIGSSVWLHRATRLLIEFLRPIPSVALIPLAILVYGRSIDMKVFLIVFACFWPLLIQTLYGVRDVDPVALDTARSFRTGRIRLLTRIVLPAAAPYIATGVRIASAVALILAITAELVVGIDGVGREIIVSQSGGAVERMYAYILAAGLLGLSLNLLVLAVERRALRWAPAYRPDEAGAR